MIKLQCAPTPVVIDPAKTALLVLDFQNYHVPRACFDAEDALLPHAIPVACRAGFQIIRLTTGYSEQDSKEIDASIPSQDKRMSICTIAFGLFAL